MTNQLPPEGRPPLFVVRSTNQSVEAGTFSLLAAFEVGLAATAAIYWWLEIRAEPEILFLSIVLAPLLLLRSKQSVELGVRWFEHYVDRSFSEAMRLPEKTFLSFRFQSSVLIALISATVATSLMGYFWLPVEGSAPAVLRGLAIGYLGTQSALAVTVAVAAKEVVAVAERTTPAVFVAILLVAAIVLGLTISGASILTIAAAVVGTILVSATAVMAAPSVVRAGVKRAERRKEGGGIAIARAIMSFAPYPFVGFFPGLFFGGWLRSVGTRFAATGCHLRAGAVALPDNWWRTLFVVDVYYPPELVPGYRRADPFNIHYLISRMRQKAKPIRLVTYSLALVILFLPAYLYRFSIKSTFWFYFPLIYLVNEKKFVKNPKVVSDLISFNRIETYRRWLLIPMVIGLVISSTTSIKASLPPLIVSPLEYGFLIDFRALRIWQWLNLFSAVITICLFAYSDTFRIYVNHSPDDSSIATKVVRATYWIEIARRARSICTIAVLVIAFIHAVLWATPAQKYIPANVKPLLKTIYGNELPNYLGPVTTP